MSSGCRPPASRCSGHSVVQQRQEPKIIENEHNNEYSDPLLHAFTTGGQRETVLACSSTLPPRDDWTHQTIPAEIGTRMDTF